MTGAGLVSYAAANVGFSTAGNLSNVVDTPIVKDLRNHTLTSSPLSTCPNPNMQHSYELQSKIDEASKKLVDANKWYEDKYVTPEEDNISHKNDEPQWHKDLHKSETTEEIMDGDTLSNLFYEGNNSDYQFATSNVTEPARISETIGSNQTAVARHSNVDTSDTCPANSYTSLEKYNIGTCPSQDICPNETSSLWSYIRSFISFGSHEYCVNTIDSSVKGSDYQFAKPNVTEPARISEIVRSNQTTIPDNVTVSTDKYAEREFCSVDGDNKSTFANLFSARVDNSINTSRQQGTLMDYVDLEERTREVHPSAYPNGLSRVL